VHGTGQDDDGYRDPTALRRLMRKRLNATPRQLR